MGIVLSLSFSSAEKICEDYSYINGKTIVIKRVKRTVKLIIAPSDKNQWLEAVSLAKKGIIMNVRRYTVLATLETVGLITFMQIDEILEEINEPFNPSNYQQ